MNRATKSALIYLNSSPFLDLRAALFHSTPVLDRRRRPYWEFKPKFRSRRHKRFNREELLKDVHAFSENLFQSWHDHDDEYDSSSSRGSSWFRRSYGPRGSNGSRHNKKWSQSRDRRKGFQFCDDDAEVDTIFRSAFGGNGFYFWSFINDEEPLRSSSGFYNGHRTSWNQRHRFEDEDEDESSSESDREEPDLVKDRMALGLRRSGPLNLEDVKNAYRACALKWHPDRHEGSSKAMAEEKFKVCSAAYQSLCDKLALN